MRVFSVGKAPVFTPDEVSVPVRPTQATSRPKAEVVPGPALQPVKPPQFTFARTPRNITAKPEIQK
jgi:hypothetical protein